VVAGTGRLGLCVLGVLAPLLAASVALAQSQPGTPQDEHPLASKNPTGVRVVQGVVATACTDKKTWTWRDGSGRTRSLAELKTILDRAYNWHWSGGKTGARADLSGADLSGCDLSGASMRAVILKRANLALTDLRNADLTFADLSNANLTSSDARGATMTARDLRGALLSFTRLEGAWLTNAKLSSSFFHANLTGADLLSADLSGALIMDSNLTGAHLNVANLSGAVLLDTELTGADFVSADLNGTDWEPKSNPMISAAMSGVALAQHLELLTYRQNPNPLVQLRRGFEEAGFRSQERKITYVLRHRQSQDKLGEALGYTFSHPALRRLIPKNWHQFAEAYSNYHRGPEGSRYSNLALSWLDYVFDKVMFDFTCRYGVEPNRCLKLGAWLWLCLVGVYLLLMHLRGRSGIYCVKNQEPAQRAPRKVRIHFRRISVRGRWKPVRYSFRLLRLEWRLLRAAIFFSLMSAFNIGFRDINFGRWLRLLTKREYDLKPVSWARTNLRLSIADQPVSNRAMVPHIFRPSVRVIRVPS
jgi:uncharacterized protein YjbI with pentapeptide repeats